MRRYIIILLALIPLISTAQNDDNTNNSELEPYIFKQEVMNYPKYRIGWSPTALLHWYPSFQISNDYGVSKNINLTLETGVIYKGNPFFTRTRDIYHTSGFEARLGIEYGILQLPNLIFSLGLAQQHKTILLKNKEWVDKQSYRKYEDIRNNLKYNTTYITTSIHSQLSKKVLMDIGAGLGTASREWTETYEPTVTDYFYDFFCNINLSYVLKN